MWIADVSIRRPVTTITVMGAIVLFGWFAYRGMGMDSFPEVEFPVVSVQTALPGASPEVIDQDVTDPIEEQIKTIAGIRSLKSQSFEGFSIVTVEFELSKDIDVAADEVRAKVALARQNLPKDIDDPIVEKLDLGSFPFMWLGVTSSGDYGQLVYYADKVLKEQLQSVPGVGNVQLAGYRKREIRIWVDPEKLQARGLTANDVVRAVQAKHVELPGGRIEMAQSEFSVKVEGEYASVAELAGLVVAERDGTVIRLSDIGRVDDGFEDLRTISRFNATPAIGLGVRKQSGKNTVAVAQAVRERLDELRRSAPEGVKIETAFDATEFIRRSIEGVQIDIVFGIILTSIIMFVFLRNARVTFITVISIPISLIGGFIFMNALGFTMNNMSMLAMSLAVGLVIDDAIVVVENIFRHVEEGASSREAAGRGTAEVGFAVLAATSSIASVFIPVAFMKGIIGRFFYQFGLTVAATILISALIGLTLTPFLSSRLLRHQKSHGRVYTTLENGFLALERIYRVTLGWAVRHRVAVVGIALAALVGGLMLVPMIGSEFITQADEGNFMINFELPTGTGIEVTNQRLRELEDILYAQPEVESAFAAIALGMGMGQEVNKGLMFITLAPKSERQASQREVMDRLREKMTFTDMIVTLETFNPFGGSDRNTDVAYVILGPTTKDLAAVADRVIAQLKSDGGFVDLDTDLRVTKPDVKVYINRGLANDLGVDTRSISEEIYALFGGVDVAKFKDGGYRYDIRLRALPQYRGTPEDLDRIAIRSESGELVKAPNLIRYDIGTGPNVINRYDRRRSVTLYANAQGIPAGQALAHVEETVARLLPKDGRYGATLTGQAATFRESFESMLIALGIAILIIYMILAIQFESFIHPFTIMASLPFSMIGVFGALLLTGATLNIFSFIGIIMLMGIVTKNGILLVDFANKARERGADKVAAMLEAGPIRLRPILMTAFSTVIGIFPVALGMSEGGETRAPLAIAVIGGALTSTFLTLLVIPVIYLLLDDLGAFVTRAFSFGSRQATPAATGGSAPGEAFES